MLRLLAFLIAVALAVGGALVLVSERAAITRAGYRTAELQRERRELVERNRKLRVRVAQLKTATHLIRRAKDLELEVAPPEALLERRAGDEASP